MIRVKKYLSIKHQMRYRTLAVGPRDTVGFDASNQTMSIYMKSGENTVTIEIPVADLLYATLFAVSCMTKKKGRK